jgi:hypothetical protein
VNPRLEERLRDLGLRGSLPRSACSAALLRVLQHLLQGGVVGWERVNAGKRLRVVRSAEYGTFLSQSFPWTSEEASGLPARIAGVARFRDSKSLANDTVEIVTVRAWGEAALRLNGEALGAANATAQYGVFSFLLDPSHHSIHGRCALVENPAVLAAFEELRLAIPLVIYGRGRISSKMVSWMVQCSGPDFSLLHLADYDATGLSDFSRLRRALGERVTLHRPGNLRVLFGEFGKRELVETRGSQRLLSRLRNSSYAEVREVTQLIDEFTCGLEQESLLVAAMSEEVRSAG